MPPRAVADHKHIRTIAITAIFSDDVLYERVALKGGNALSLVHEIGVRTSLDLDFSIEGDFKDSEEVKQRIFKALTDRYDAAGFSVFDLRFERRPSVPRDGQDPRWGGYMVTFKLMEKEKYEALRHDLEAVPRDALVIGPEERRLFTIDLSKYEYTKGKLQVDVDDYTIFVYSPEMIVVEKIRAICQQMPEYLQQKAGRPRARDFFDIHSVLSHKNIDLASAATLDLTRNIFAAKDVPLRLIANIPNQREFHRPDWDSVRASAPKEINAFDFYFDFVVERTKSMHSLWEK
jgi:predicted nucleotidyltransferase component of viral defense system